MSHPLLSPSILRNLSDKSYEKRKQAALEIEHLIKEVRDNPSLPSSGAKKGAPSLLATNATSNSGGPSHSFQQDEKHELIRSVIATLTRDFALSQQSNQRKGGLIGLAASSIALMEETPLYLDHLLPPVLKCFSDPESRVRYYACEALYNITKVARGSILLFFNEVFDGLCKLYSDPDVDVKNGAALLDRLLKDLVVESADFEVERFIPLLKERIRIKNPFIRQLLVGWITVLDSVPDIDMIEFLPEYLGGLFEMLGDPNKDIRQQAYAALSELLRELISTQHQNQNLDLSTMMQILVSQANDTKDNFTRLTLLTWIHEFILIDSKGKLLPHTSEILGVVLVCISDSEKEIRTKSEKTNESLLRLVQSNGKSVEPELDVTILFERVTNELTNKWVLSRMASLRWINTLMAMFPSRAKAPVNALFPALLKTLHDQDDAVIRIDLEILARISLGDTTLLSPYAGSLEPMASNSQFEMVLSAVMALFAHDRRFLETRGSLVVRQLCELLDAEAIYRAFAKLLSQMNSDEAISKLAFPLGLNGFFSNSTPSDNEFISSGSITNQLELATLMVQTLNLILLTSPELFELRSRLKRALYVPQSKALFETIFYSWCHNPVSTFALCLLAEAYELSAAIILRIAQLELTVGALMQMDTLVQLIESPIFVHIRLHLLEPLRHPRLVQALYGLLMLMPQSAAFTALNTRLSSVASLSLLAAHSKATGLPVVMDHNLTSDRDNAATGESALDRASMLEQFAQIQTKHSKKRQALFRQQSLLSDASSNSTSIATTPQSIPSQNTPLDTQSTTVNNNVK